MPRPLVAIDPRVELFSLIFRLAGNPEYNQCRLASYAEDLETQFGAQRDHAVVKLAAELRKTRGVSYDACMALAVHVEEAYDLKLKVPLEPWPESIDKRWNEKSVTKFLAAAREFVKTSGFREFFDKHRGLYETTEEKMRILLNQKAHLDWFGTYFGEQAKPSFSVVLGMLNGGSCYGPHFQDTTGRQEFFCILGVWQTNSLGAPEFTEPMVGTVVHEFGHSYANPVMDHHEAELRTAGEILFARVGEKMRSQAYGSVNTMFRESLVRACVVRYIHQYKVDAEAQKVIRAEEKNGFLWMRELSDLLGEYETQRAKYPTLESFSPRLIAFFKQYAADVGSKQAAIEAKQPKVVSMIPRNGATNVDSALTEIRVTFDRPMKDGTWSLCGSGPHYPEATGKPHYNETRTVWTMPVKLKPAWDYEFGINCPSYGGFRSQEGVSLEPIAVKFKTADSP
jgi:hypothetical protein